MLLVLTRRSFVAAGLGTAGALFAAKPAGLKFGVMDTVFHMAGPPDSVDLAAKLSLTAVQVTLGRSADGKTPPLEDTAIQSA